MSTISDRARDFWDRISPRERRLVVIAAVAVPLTLAIWLGLAIHDGLVAMETRNDHTRKAIGVVEELHAKGAAAPTTADDDTLAKMGTEPLSLRTHLDTAAHKVGVVIKQTTPHQAVTRNGYVTSSVSCPLDKVTIDQLKSFLQEVEASKVVAITHLDIRRDFRDKEKLNATLEVSTYSKEPPKKDDSTGSNTGSGTGKGG
jgi:type II secretory pathway component PulM